MSTTLNAAEGKVLQITASNKTIALVPSLVAFGRLQIMLS